ncbi:tyrosine-protein phosphatase [Erysipelothrix sp. D19-032]
MKSELINFRDFGGYPTQDGRFIKEAIFFRCGSYRDLTEEDRDYIRSLNIQNLCDYREVSELDRDELRETFAKKVYTISKISNISEALKMIRTFHTRPCHRKIWKFSILN